MTRFLFATAFLLGAIVVVWMGMGFVNSDMLALTVTIVIGVVYIIGFVEQIQFRAATSTLSQALDEIQGSITNLDDWLSKLDPVLQNAVRVRIEGERVMLPLPVMTPYLVGLLVMLGLMGTFAGMVITLKGAVTALEGTTELQAIRAGLAAPIGGLGLAFGTSVAGVAASAMLGLISTLSRRERMLETGRLDSKIATEFSEFSLVHKRQETYRALQYQAKALPDVAESLKAMASQLESMGDRIGAKLIENQQHFHGSINSAYTDLAASVDKTIRESLAESARLTGESIQPIVSKVISNVKEQTQSAQQQLNNSAKSQIEQINIQFAKTTEQVTQAWKKGLLSHQESNKELVDNLGQSFNVFNNQFNEVANRWANDFTSRSSNWLEQLIVSDKERIALWDAAFHDVQDKSLTQITSVSQKFTEELKEINDNQKTTFTILSSELKSVSSNLSSQWQNASEQAKDIQKQNISTLTQISQDLAEENKITAQLLKDELSDLFDATEGLVEARIKSEEIWLAKQSQRVDEVTQGIKTELSALREDEAERANAAIDRLAGLEKTVAEHLSVLGQSLEEPMARLMQTASEAPKAAAEVIESLRSEISKNIERDNDLLEERKRIMEELNNLLTSIDKTSAGQREAVETLITASSGMLENVGGQFSELVGSEANKLSEIADNFAASTVEMSSLGESFSLAVEMFNDSNQGLIESLGKIENSLDKSSERSDEQLAYYINQAREIIDHSMMSQKEILEEMRQISRQPDLFNAEAETNE